MDDIYSLFVMYCLQTCSHDEYGDKKRVREHNKAITRLNMLQEQMNSMPDRSCEVVYELLNHEDSKVRLYAASHCLKYNLNMELAVFTLTQLRDYCVDKTISFSAEMTLKHCI